MKCCTRVGMISKTVTLRVLSKSDQADGGQPILSGRSRTPAVFSCGRPLSPRDDDPGRGESLFSRHAEGLDGSLRAPCLAKASLVDLRALRALLQRGVLPLRAVLDQLNSTLGGRRRRGRGRRRAWTWTWGKAVARWVARQIARRGVARVAQDDVAPTAIEPVPKSLSAQGPVDTCCSAHMQPCSMIQTAGQKHPVSLLECRCRVAHATPKVPEGFRSR